MLWISLLGFTFLVTCVRTLDVEVVTMTELSPEPAINTRIIGGSAATIEQYPFVVQIIVNQGLICGGSLLTRRHVLSAAHCFVDESNTPVEARFFSVRVGTALLNSGGSLHSVSRITIHESYNNPVRDNDLAILLLTTDVTYSTSVGAAAIPRQGTVLPDNSTVIHLGWGRTNVSTPSGSQVLQQVTVQKVNQSICAARYNFLTTATGQPFPVTDGMICSGLLDVGGADACQGDSGGPLVYGGGGAGSGAVVGVTSWGWGCAEPQFPGVSARVPTYSDWINATVTRYNNASFQTIKPATLIALVLLSVSQCGFSS